jgi:hypothetical protein
VKLSSTFLGVALLAVSAVAFHLWRELQEGREQTAALASKLQEPQYPTAASPTLTPTNSGSLADQSLQASTETKPSESPDNSAIVPKALDAEAIRTQLESPEGMALRKATMRRMQGDLYPDVDQALDLTTAEADELLKLLADQRLRGSTPVGNNPASPRDRETESRKAREAEEAELQALLGSKYPKWQEYKQIADAWRQRRDLRTALDAAGIPLTQTQDRALIGALSAAQRSINQNRSSDTPGNSMGQSGRYSPENRQRMLDAAAAYLSPQQLDGYQALLERKATTEQRLSRRPE